MFFTAFQISKNSKIIVNEFVHFLGTGKEMILALRRASTKRSQTRPMWDTPMLNKVQKNTSFTEENESPKSKPIITLDNQISLNSTTSDANQSHPIYINLTYEYHSPQTSESSDSASYLMGTRV